MMLCSSGFKMQMQRFRKMMIEGSVKVYLVGQILNLEPQK